MNCFTKARFDDTPNQRELDNRKVAYEAACEGMVLLKNDGALPFSHKKVALYGPGASMTIKGGTGSGEVNERHSVTILEGLEDRGFDISTRNWIAKFEESYEQEKEAYKVEKRKRLNIFKPNSIMQMLFDNFRSPGGPAITEEDVRLSDTDQCVYVISRQAGEGGDRKVEKGDFCLTDVEKEAIRFCAAHYDKFVLAINCGSSIDMSFVDEIPGINAIIYLCQLGTEGGHAFADVLSGVASPSGKLTDTWAKSYDQIPFGASYSSMDGNPKVAEYREGIFVGYRYFDTFREEPAYPFGFGLSYTDFTIHSAGVMAEGSQITVKAMVKNVGQAFSGKEVAQLYVSPPTGTMQKEYQSLMAFAKTDVLAPGEQQVVTLTFPMAAVASYREADAAFVLEAGDYFLRLGNSSRNTTVVGAVTLDEEIIVSRHEHICPLQQSLEEMDAPVRTYEPIAEGLPRLSITAADIPTVTYTYQTPAVREDADVKAILDTLTVKEMVDIVVGIGFFGGEKRFHLPGSVGNTTSKFWDRGLANVALCDGPAGLRIQKKSTISKDGKIKAVELAMSTFDALPGFVKKFLVGDPEKDRVLYQYTTAFPVTAALAQSWNTALMEKVGNAIFREMEEYGCTYWLAPAVNIHRNPLCGRNFEYYSEDPRLTGLMAAAITRGVQQEKGYYVTVKHFACNNQEDQRTFSDSRLSERTLREIYLRAFELTVREGGAKSIMTSYNLLNGVYTPNSYDLCTKVLRNEWGFDGVVMTDWFSTNPGQGRNDLCMSAGNDLIMPGGASFKGQILRGLRSGKISEEDIRRCCANVIRAILDSPTQREYIGK